MTPERSISRRTNHYGSRCYPEECFLCWSLHVCMHLAHYLLILFADVVLQNVEVWSGWPMIGQNILGAGNSDSDGLALRPIWHEADKRLQEFWCAETLSAVRLGACGRMLIKQVGMHSPEVLLLLPSRIDDIISAFSCIKNK